jgi:hypothetical protein
VQPMMLALSVVLGILPLLGIVWTVVNGTLTTVDGLFMSLILLTLSGLFFLNAFLECRDCGLIKLPSKGKTTTPAAKK